MKIILPVAGVGTRLRPLTLHLPKCLLPVAGNTIIGHILDALAPLSVSEYIFVTGYQSVKVEDYIRKSYGHLNSRFVLQANPQGLGEALHLCTPSLPDNEPVLIILGDTLFDADLLQLSNSSTNVLCTRVVQDPSRFGVAVTGPDGKISKLVEKPKDFVSNQALVGIYFIQSVAALKRALESLVSQDMRTRGEYQLTDALQLMIDAGEEFHTGEIQGWLDCGKHDALLETNRLLLSRTKSKHPGEFPGCTIIEPCYIAESAQIQNSIIGPNVSLHEHCRVQNSLLRDCVVAANGVLDGCSLEYSILGESVMVRHFNGSLHLGDHSEINPED
ncbi:MAG TPA: sugar phosphate nucleotidyltransferase [Fibrobacteraceae bacterium]|nr:sugar phosphate nucleotidyltransferase [Fibrobacteraceae bacterium]